MSEFSVQPQTESNRLAIVVNGLGTVLLNRTSEGLILDIWPLHDSDEPVVALGMLNEDFEDEVDHE